MEHFQNVFQHAKQNASGILSGLFIVSIQFRLDPFQVPVAELVPGELVYGRGYIVKIVACLLYTSDAADE